MFPPEAEIFTALRKKVKVSPALKAENRSLLPHSYSGIFFETMRNSQNF